MMTTKNTSQLLIDQTKVNITGCYGDVLLAISLIEKDLQIDFKTNVTIHM